MTLKDEEQIISEKKYKLILDNSNDLIAILNKDFEHEYINESAYLNILGYSKEDIIGKRVRDFTHPDDILRSSKILKRNLIKGEILDEYRIKHKNGHYIWVETKGNFLKENGQITGAIFVSRDISERKQMEYELKESEQILRAILESTADGILVIDKDGKVIHTNNKFVNMWHIPQNLIKERDDKKLISYVLNQLKDPHAFLSRVTQLYTSTNQDFDTINFKDGRIYERFSSPLIREGEMYGRVRSFRDITDEKMAEQKLKKSEEKYRKLFESSTEGIAAADIGGNLIDVNDTYLKMLGYSKEEVLGLNFRDITPHKWHEMEDILIVKQLSEEKHSGIYEKEFIRKDGTIIPVDIRFWILNDEQGDPAIMWAIIRDITEPKRIEQELLRINKLKSEFLRRASHELKTPLSSIKGFSDLILALYREDLNPDIISKLEEIDLGCERLQNIINDLLLTSKLESSEFKPRLQREDLSFLIHYCIDELSSLAVKREHSINIEIQASIITRFEKEEIYDVISNLLANAIKYTPPRGWIDIKTEIKDDFIIISIKDNGIGFTEEEKGKIFKQFGKIERYGQGLDLGIDGTGLGLYISKKIVESHGGKIWMESEGKNKGSTFYFSLPLIKN
ncbi:MAG: PAS domain S-box protein [Candidatus Lokiarchaeia archaeon]